MPVIKSSEPCYFHDIISDTDSCVVEDSSANDHESQKVRYDVQQVKPPICYQYRKKLDELENILRNKCHQDSLQGRYVGFDSPSYVNSCVQLLIDNLMSETQNFTVVAKHSARDIASVKIVSVASIGKTYDK